MIYVDSSWKEAHKRNILPETDVEITCGLATSTTLISNINEVNAAEHSKAGYQPFYDMGTVDSCSPTLERNLWFLDGSIGGTDGYVNDGSNDAGLEVVLSTATDTPIPGITIGWGSESAGYATDFTVTAKKAGEVVATVTIVGNKDQISVVDLEIESYDSLGIDILGWSLPERRARITRLVLGQQIVFDKKNILSYEHEQHGHPNSGEISQNRIRFTLDNRDDLWNPVNETGAAKYLAERLAVGIRYGMRVGATTQWIDLGKLYLEDWKLANDGLSISFSACDYFAILQNRPYKGGNYPGWTLENLVFGVLASANEDYIFNIGFRSDGSLAKYNSPDTELDVSEAALLQMCANAACCTIRFEPDGAIDIRPNTSQNRYNGMAMSGLDYTIPLELAYSHPEISLSKQLKAVTVSYGNGQKYTLEVGTTGETQTVDNSLVTTVEQAEEIALWVKNTLESRKKVRGEFRADPRLELFDVVTVETKYGTMYPVLITHIKYSYTGTFRGSYEGYVITLPEEA